MDQIVADKTLVDTVRRHALNTPDAVAFHFDGRDTTYAEFDRNTNKVANALIAAGFKHGDHICFLARPFDGIGKSGSSRVIGVGNHELD